MEVDQTQQFNQKLSQWIAGQGFWFQLRHSMSGGGDWSMTLNHLFRLGFKLAIALLVAAAGFGIYLVNRVNSPEFAESMSADLAVALRASEAQINDFNRDGEGAMLRRVGAEGSEGAFFKTLDAGSVRFNMKIHDGLTGVWDAGALRAKWLDLRVKGGADSPEEAALMGDAFFREWKGFRFSSVEVDLATIHWGSSFRTAGQIEKSHLKATRSAGGWRLVFTGGLFSQNWLKDLTINELVVECDASGMVVTKAEFRKGAGEVTFTDLKISGGDQPEVSGRVAVSKVKLSDILPATLHPFVDGVVSSDLKISGSTNTHSGISFEGDIVLGGVNYISLRDQIPLLKTLTVVDLYNNYRRIDIDRGSFHMKTGGGMMTLSKMNIRSEELMTLSGQFEVSYPKDEDLIDAMRSGSSGRFTPVFDPSMVARTSSDVADGELSLDALKTRGDEGPKDQAMFNRRSQEKIDEILAREFMLRRAQELECNGLVKITIPGQAFDRSDDLREAYPLNVETGRTEVEVPLKGPLFEVTRKQAEEILGLGTEH